MAQRLASSAAPQIATAISDYASPAASELWAETPDDGSRLPTILIVDQNPTNRKLVRALLQPVRCRILEAPRPSQALSLVQSEHVDLVVTEIVSPEIDGLELCRRLKSRRATRMI